MEYTFIEWIKTSIPGIILLGAIGSILAAALLKLLALVVARWLLPAKSSLTKYVYGFRNGPQLVIEHLKASQDPRELLVTVALILAAQILVGGGIATGTVLTALGSISHSQNAEASQHLIFSGSFLSFISLLFFAKLTRHLLAIYMIHMSAVEKAVADIISKQIGHQESMDGT
ncbi:hypothetical protein [Flavihumibacter sp.]|uniref:hypothetical protein n=1 Tax=Flavihumibacter sp. TaxID=1913981 RepID=UPI002FCC2274